MTRLVVGCMTGTSIDGIDAALVRIDGKGLAMRASLLRHHHADLGPCADGLRRIANDEPLRASEITAITRDFALRHAEVIKQLCGRKRPDLVCVHGQTVYHKPPLSWQLMQPAPIAAALRTRVVCDLRAADLAASGQGAPLTPLADYILFAGPDRRAIINLGGFCNITLLPAAARRSPAGARAVRGKDVCVCNLLLDEIARRKLNAPFDMNGAAALAGAPKLKGWMTLLRLLQAQGASRRSLGSGDELHAWLAKEGKSLSGPDCAATAGAAIAAAIAKACAKAQTLVLAGGGAKNAYLVKRLRESLPRAQVVTTDHFGIPVEAREAAGFAVLGALADDGVPVSLSRVTGVRSAPRAGLFAPAP